MTVYGWHQISDVPAEPGVYAWYYTPEITAFDLAQAQDTLVRLKAEGGERAAKDYLRIFLEHHLFRYFREEPYTAVIRGALKPRYEGEITHRSTVSSSLVSRIVEDPSRLATIKDVVEKSAPLFASPIYIGMSDRLRIRLGRHKDLIEGYGRVAFTSAGDADDRDHSFAREVRSRSIPPPRLFVVVQVIAAAADSYVDVENILNRIHYPLLGRN